MKKTETNNEIKMANWQLKQRQDLPLEAKIEFSKKRIREWYDHWEGQVYISFSGGLDSRVLLDLIRNIYPNIPAVFVDTGLEYPEIRDFVKTFDNVICLKPKMPFTKVIEKYGYPILSKEVSMGFDRYRKTKSPIQKSLRINGGINPSSGKKQNRSIPLKWQYLLNSGYKFSEKCCDVMKKNPLYKYEKETDQKAFVGTRVDESRIRQLSYLKTGCNAFDAKKPISTPLSIWTDQDVKDYIHKFNISYSEIYDMGEKRTGCMFCMFGVHLEKGENRFQRMAKTHPKLYDYCITKLGIGKVLDLISVNY